MIKPLASLVGHRAEENTSPTRKRGVGTIPRLRVGLVLKPLVQLLAAISSAQRRGDCRAQLSSKRRSGPSWQLHGLNVMQCELKFPHRSLYFGALSTVR